MQSDEVHVFGVFTQWLIYELSENDLYVNVDI